MTLLVILYLRYEKNFGSLDDANWTSSLHDTSEAAVIDYNEDEANY